MPSHHGGVAVSSTLCGDLHPCFGTWDGPRASVPVVRPPGRTGEGMKDFDDEALRKEAVSLPPRFLSVKSNGNFQERNARLQWEETMLTWKVVGIVGTSALVLICCAFARA